MWRISCHKQNHVRPGFYSRAVFWFPPLLLLFPLHPCLNPPEPEPEPASASWGGRLGGRRGGGGGSRRGGPLPLRAGQSHAVRRGQRLPVPRPEGKPVPQGWRRRGGRRRGGGWVRLSVSRPYIQGHVPPSTWAHRQRPKCQRPRVTGQAAPTWSSARSQPEEQPPAQPPLAQRHLLRNTPAPSRWAPKSPDWNRFPTIRSEL